MENYPLIIFTDTFIALQWKEVPQDQLMDSKLKCVFEMPTTTGETTVSIFLAYFISLPVQKYRARLFKTKYIVS